MNNIKDISNNIFNNKLKSDNSIQLYLDENTNHTIEEIFFILLELFTEGMKILFSKDNISVNLEEITNDQFILIHKYFNSFGFNISYTLIPEIDDNYINNLDKLPDLNDIKIKEKLSDYFIRLKTNNNNLSYKLSFDFYISNTNCKN